MRPIAIALAAVVIMAAGVWADENTVQVTGRAELREKPDVAYVTLYVKADGVLMTDAAKKADQSVEELRKAVQAKCKDLRSFDVIDVAVGGKQRDPWGSERGDDNPRPEVTRRIRFAVAPNPKKVYELVDTAIRSGALMQGPSAVQIPYGSESVVVYGLLESSGPEAQAREAAMADARRQAKDLAAIVGKTIGHVVKIQCRDAVSPGLQMRVMGQLADLPTEHIGISPDEIVICHSMSVTFELKSE